MMPRCSRVLAVTLLILSVAAGDEKRPAQAVADALRTARDEKADPAVRASAIRSLRDAPLADVKSLLSSSFGVRQPLPVQLAALDVLGRHHSTDVPTAILAAWPSLTPTVRAAAAEALLARPDRVVALLDAIEQKTVLPIDLDPSRIQSLRKTPDEKVRARAEKVLAAGGSSKRQDVIDKYRKALDLKGDVARGMAIFKETCAACHQIGRTDEAGGPDLAASQRREPIDRLTDIIDPNRTVLPRYANYLIVGDDDTIVSGVIAAETATAVTVRKSDGTSESVQRAKISSLRATGLSAMPDGLEEKIDVQGMADLLAYLRSLEKR